MKDVDALFAHVYVKDSVNILHLDCVFFLAFLI